MKQDPSRNLQAIATLLPRLLGHDLSRRPTITVLPSEGTTWLCYAGTAEPVRARELAKLTDGGDRTVSYVGKGNTPDEAVNALAATLSLQVRNRILSDIGAFEVAWGEVFDLGTFRAPTPREDADDHPTKKPKGSGEPITYIDSELADAARGMVKRR